LTDKTLAHLNDLQMLASTKPTEYVLPKAELLLQRLFDLMAAFKPRIETETRIDWHIEETESSSSSSDPSFSYLCQASLPVRFVWLFSDSRSL